jgi:hypothetical protein
MGPCCAREPRAARPVVASSTVGLAHPAAPRASGLRRRELPERPPGARPAGRLEGVLSRSSSSSELGMVPRKVCRGPRRTRSAGQGWRPERRPAMHRRPPPRGPGEQLPPDVQGVPPPAAGADSHRIDAGRARRNTARGRWKAWVTRMARCTPRRRALASSCRRSRRPRGPPRWRARDAALGVAAHQAISSWYGSALPVRSSRSTRPVRQSRRAVSSRSARMGDGSRGEPGPEDDAPGHRRGLRREDVPARGQLDVHGRCHRGQEQQGESGGHGSAHAAQGRLGCTVVDSAAIGL